ASAFGSAQRLFREYAQLREAARSIRQTTRGAPEPLSPSGELAAIPYRRLERDHRGSVRLAAGDRPGNRAPGVISGLALPDSGARLLLSERREGHQRQISFYAAPGRPALSRGGLPEGRERNDGGIHPRAVAGLSDSRSGRGRRLVAAGAAISAGLRGRGGVVRIRPCRRAPFTRRRSRSSGPLPFVAQRSFCVLLFGGLPPA